MKSPTKSVTPNEADTLPSHATQLAPPHAERPGAEGPSGAQRPAAVFMELAPSINLHSDEQTLKSKRNAKKINSAFS